MRGQFSVCGQLDPAYSLLDNKTFAVVVNDPVNYAVIDCVAGTKPFETIVALPVFGLNAGTYAYTVNGKYAGNFTLTVDNTLLKPIDTVCTMEAKRCPDGSFVGRTGPDCAFSACPAS